MKPKPTQPVPDDTKQTVNDTDAGEDTHVEEIDMWKNKYLRALADYQNLEKRVNTEKDDIRLYANERLLAKLLPVIDTLERAQKHIGDTGLDLALKELHAVLTTFGVTKVATIGKQFDPYMMECIEVVEGKNTIVIEVVEEAYALQGKILREAKVKVGGGEKKENQEDTPANK